MLPFDLHISTSGFAVALRELSAASATQRAVISIAKREFVVSAILMFQASPLCLACLWTVMSTRLLSLRNLAPQLQLLGLKRLRPSVDCLTMPPRSNWLTAT